MPGTYGTSLLRNHAMRGVFAEMERCGFPTEVVESIRDSVDCNLYFLADRSRPVREGTMYLILGGMVALLIAIYVVMNLWKKKRSSTVENAIWMVRIRHVLFQL